MELTKKKLFALAEDIGAVELKTGDPEVAKLSKMHLRCIAYSWSTKGCCTARLYRVQNGDFYVAKTHAAVCYVAYMAELLQFFGLIKTLNGL